MKATPLDPFAAFCAFSRCNRHLPIEPYRVLLPCKDDPIRQLDSIALATLAAHTPGQAWRPVARGPLHMITARLVAADAAGELDGLDGYQVARWLWPMTPSQFVPWRGLGLLRDIDADDRTDVVVTGGSPGNVDGWPSHPSGERLRDRLSSVSAVRCGQVRRAPVSTGARG